MSTVLTNNPTNAQTTAMQSFRGTGRATLGYGLDGSLFASGLPEGHIEKAVIYQFWNQRRHFHLHTMLRLLDEARYKPVADRAFEWREYSKFRIGEQAVGAATGGAATETVELNTEETRVVVGEVLKSPRGWTARIESVTPGVPSTSNTEVVLRKTDGTNWAVADISANDILGVNHTRYGEGSSAPDGKRWYPLNKANYITTLRRSAGWTGDAAATAVEIILPGGETTWAPQSVMLTLLELKKDIENVLMFGEEKATDTNGGTSTRGLDTDIYANASNQVTYTTFAESDLQDALTGMNDFSDSMEYFLFYGINQGKDIHTVLKDYFMDGATNRGVFNGRERLAAGFNVKSYSFMDYILHCNHYRQFDNDDEMGNAGAAAATVIDYSNYGLLVNAENSSASFMQGGGYGATQSIPGICLIYRKAGNVNRGFTYGIENGITGEFVGGDVAALPGNTNGQPGQFAHMVSSGNDETKIHFLSEVAIMACNVENAHGLIRKNA